MIHLLRLNVDESRETHGLVLEDPTWVQVGIVHGRVLSTLEPKDLGV